MRRFLIVVACLFTLWSDGLPPDEPGDDPIDGLVVS